MTGPLYRLGRAAAIHWRLVLPLWLVLVVAVVLVANTVDRPTNNNLDLPGTGSTQATDLLERGLPKQANGSVPIVLQAREGALTAGSNKKAVQKTVKELGNDRYVTTVISPLSAQGQGRSPPTAGSPSSPSSSASAPGT